MTDRKPILIVGRTAAEADEHALAHRLGSNWKFVVHMDDLLAATPVPRDWRERQDIAAIRERARGQGFKVPS